MTTRAVVRASCCPLIVVRRHIVRRSKSGRGHHSLTSLSCIGRRVNVFRPDHSPAQNTQLQRWSRGAKKSSRIDASELPQGALMLEPLARDAERPSYPTVVRQAWNNMRRFDKCVLLTRVGSFYEVPHLCTAPLYSELELTNL